MRERQPKFFESSLLPTNLKVELQLEEVAFKNDTTTFARSEWAQLIDINHVECRAKLGEYDQILKGDLPEWQPRAFALDADDIYLQFVNLKTGEKVIIPINLQDPNLTKLELYIWYTLRRKCFDCRERTPGYFRVNVISCGASNAIMLHYHILQFTDSILLSPVIKDSTQTDLIPKIWKDYFETTFTVCN